MNKDLAIVIIFLLIIGVLFFASASSLNFNIGGGDPYLSPRFRVEEPSASGGAASRARRPSLQTLRDSANRINIFDNITRERQRRTERREIISNTGDAVNPNESIYKGAVSLKTGRAKESDVSREYITISLPSRSKIERVTITGFKLKNSKGEEFTIGTGSELPFSAVVNPQVKAVLNRGDEAAIITGRSPIGTSFRQNICTGYFEQFQDFNPSLSRACPFPSDEEKIKGAGLSDICLDYIERLPRCQIPLGQRPLNLDVGCLNYVNENINYSACVAGHRFDKNFYSGEWHIYLNRDAEIWRERKEKISLYDEVGKLVAEVEY